MSSPAVNLPDCLREDCLEVLHQFHRHAEASVKAAMRAAAAIAAFTALSRVVGFVRMLVFAGAVGSTDLGDIYQTANTIPNVVFEIVAGGALAVVVVPLISPAIADADTRRDGVAGRDISQRTA